MRTNPIRRHLDTRPVLSGYSPRDIYPWICEGVAALLAGSTPEQAAAVVVGGSK